MKINRLITLFICLAIFSNCDGCSNNGTQPSGDEGALTPIEAPSNPVVTPDPVEDSLTDGLVTEDDEGDVVPPSEESDDEEPTAPGARIIFRGTILNETTENGVANVSVSIKNCEACSVIETTTNAQGIFEVAALAPSKIITPKENALAVEVTLTLEGFGFVKKYITPVYRLNDAGDSVAQFTERLFSSEAPDADLDLIVDAYEDLLGTNANNPDSDSDGVSDGWEWYGRKFVDFYHLGGSARQRDIYFEVDYHHYKSVKTGKLVSGEIVKIVQNEIKELFQSMPITLDLGNGEVSQGVYPHFVHDTPLAGSFKCFGDNEPEYQEETVELNPRNPNFDGVFYKIVSCRGKQSFGHGRGLGVSKGSYIKLLVPNVDEDPSNDATEFGHFVLYRVFLHEFGHNMGLNHGGDNRVNNKVNYPSVMNYAYKWAQAVASYAVTETSINYSEGLLPAFDERNLSEVNPFPDFSVEDLAFLNNYGQLLFKDNDFGFGVYPCTDDAELTCVDWNRNQSLETEIYAMKVHRTTPDDHHHGQVTTDHNDFAVIERNLGFGLSAGLQPGEADRLGLEPNHIDEF